MRDFQSPETSLLAACLTILSEYAISARILPHACINFHEGVQQVPSTLDEHLVKHPKRPTSDTIANESLRTVNNFKQNHKSPQPYIMFNLICFKHSKLPRQSLEVLQNGNHFLSLIPEPLMTCLGSYGVIWHCLLALLQLLPCKNGQAQL